LALALRAHRRAHATQPAEQSAFNALMILRFMRDDAMTSRAQKDQAEFRTRQKSASRFCGFISVTPQRQNYGSIRNGDPHDFYRDAIGTC
jgi:hypothetical protein